jgi:hypothetical protein
MRPNDSSRIVNLKQRIPSQGGPYMTLFKLVELELELEFLQTLFVGKSHLFSQPQTLNPSTLKLANRTPQIYHNESKRKCKTIEVKKQNGIKGT